jgi:tetratricopeptide (TPR) repeat protein
MRVLCAAILAFGVCAEARAEDSSTPRHLLLGVRAFKEARYDEALVELRLVARAPDAPPDLAFYLGPTLYKLKRYDEALDVFVGSRAAPDALTDFYCGETYYQLRLFRKARAVFAGLRARGLGPALDEAAGRYVAAVDTLYKTAPTEASIDYYLAQGLEIAGRDPVLAGEYLDEARQVEALATARHRRLEIITALAVAWNASGRAQAVVDLLAVERSSPDLTWELARAFVTLGDTPRARALLDTIVKTHGAHGDEASALLAKLPP